MKKKLFGGFMKGFTLVELMVVIAIIGILSAIVIANLGATRARSRDHRRISDISNLQLALAGYLNRCGTYPTDDDLPEPITSNGGCSTTVTDPGTATVALTKLVTLGFIGSLPVDPLNTGNYKYNYLTLADGTSYCLAANLESANSSVDMTTTCSISGWIAVDNDYIVTKP